jgi:hypothetical protein
MVLHAQPIKEIFLPLPDSCTVGGHTTTASNFMAYFGIELMILPC